MSASDKAREEQGGSDYPVKDEWQDEQLHKGDIVYRWEVNEGEGGNFYTTPEEVENCADPTTGEVDAHKLGDRLQVTSYQNPETGEVSYKGQLSAYEVQEDTDVAKGTCDENLCYGKGGGSQVYIPDNDNLVRREDLDKQINSESTKVDVGKYKEQQNDRGNLYEQRQDITQNMDEWNKQSKNDLSEMQKETPNPMEDVYKENNYINNDDYNYDYGYGM